ncbi:MAG TPA: LCP family protein, partial [Acidimicrobiales bacterium]|nr:LCP family protein [Acidimicrobiales bacterium]
YRFGQVRRISIPGIVPVNTANEGGENILLVGSELLPAQAASSSDAGSSQSANSSGSGSSSGVPETQMVQHADIIMVFHLDLSAAKASVLSISPRLQVTLAGQPDSQSLNAIYAKGPSALVGALSQVFDIPVNHYVGIDYVGVETLVGSLGGVNLRFDYPVQDPLSGLSMTRTGCQTLNGVESLELLRSEDFEYFQGGQWVQDTSGSFGVAQRQRTFLGALGSKAVSAGITNPFTGNRLVGSLVNDVTLDSTYSLTDLFSLVNQLGSANLSNSTNYAVPTYLSEDSNQQLVLEYDPSQAQSIIEQFLGASVGNQNQTSQSNSIGTTQSTLPAPTIGAGSVDSGLPTGTGTPSPFAPLPQATSESTTVQSGTSQKFPTFFDPRTC